VNQVTAGRLERAADLAAQQVIGRYDALFVQAARERDLPLLTSDARLCKAGEQLHWTGQPVTHGG
jgi:predicted nucleic acid-binding protein